MIRLFDIINVIHFKRYFDNFLLKKLFKEKIYNFFLKNYFDCLFLKTYFISWTAKTVFKKSNCSKNNRNLRDKNTKSIILNDIIRFYWICIKLAQILLLCTLCNAYASFDLHTKGLNILIVNVIIGNNHMY